MKLVKNKVIHAMEVVFGYGILVCLMGGGLSFFGYLAALIVGGSPAEAICTFIYKQVYPVLVVLSVAMIVLGLVKMYLSGESAFAGGRARHGKNAADRG